MLAIIVNLEFLSLFLVRLGENDSTHPSITMIHYNKAWYIVPCRVLDGSVEQTPEQAGAGDPQHYDRSRVVEVRIQTGLRPAHGMLTVSGRQARHMQVPPSGASK